MVRIGLGQRGQKLVFHRSIERSIKTVERFPTNHLCSIKMWWNVSQLTWLSWEMCHQTLRWNGNWLTWVSHEKLHRKAGCQNWIENSSFFVQRSRDWDFLRAKKPFRLMERDGTFSIWKITNCNHCRAGADGATRRWNVSRLTWLGRETFHRNGMERFPTDPARLRNVPSNVTRRLLRWPGSAKQTWHRAVCYSDLFWTVGANWMPKVKTRCLRVLEFGIDIL